VSCNRSRICDEAEAYSEALAAKNLAANALFPSGCPKKRVPSSSSEFEPKLVSASQRFWASFIEMLELHIGETGVREVKILVLVWFS
jgi:hypothetical protein